MKTLLLILSFSVSGFAQEVLVPVEAKPVGATLINGIQYDVLETDQDLIYRKRTPRSPNKEENPTFDNILERQTMHEIGFGMTFFRTSDSRMTYPQQNGLVVFNYNFVPGATVRYNFHPATKSLRRFTFAAEASLLLSNSSSGVAISNDDSASNFVSTSPLKNWAALAEYDVIVMPWFKKKNGAFVLSSGYALGNVETHQQSGDENLPPNGGLEHFASVRLRTVSLRSMAAEWGSEDDNRSTGWSYMAFRISNKGTWKVDVGYVIPFGRSANPKVVVEK